MTFKNPNFERAYVVAEWLIERFHGDRDLLRAYMGGSRRPMLEAVGQIEREAAEQGWSRIDVELALRTLQHS